MSPIITELRRRVWGVCVHWTTQTTPRHGAALPYPEAVERFPVEEFAETVASTGAGYLVFTATHAWHWPPAPIHASERLLPGRSCKRDLIGELADAVRARGMHFMLYYNHSLNNQDDPAWQAATGWLESDKAACFENIYSVLRETGERYGNRLSGYWLDSAYTFYPHHPDWAAWTHAVRAGFSDRILCYNSGVNNPDPYTPHQDYWAGEFDTLGHPNGIPAKTASNGLPWHSLFWLDDFWLHDRPDTPIASPIYADKRLLEYVSAVREAGGFTTLNAGIYQDGSLSPETLEQLRTLGRRLQTR